jgi:hypothetical protein
MPESRLDGNGDQGDVLANIRSLVGDRLAGVEVDRREEVGARNTGCNLEFSIEISSKARMSGYDMGVPR